MSTFANPAYGPGTHVRCDVCRDPYALVEARHASALTFDHIAGRDEAEARAIAAWEFVRQSDGGLWCAGCAAVGHA